jgi:hypothetical protein
MNTKDLVYLCLEQFAMDSIFKFDTLSYKLAEKNILTLLHFLGLQVLLAILKGFTLNLFLFLF